jgi:hypothetical protein
VALFLSIPLAVPVALFETFGRMRRGTVAPAPAAGAVVPNPSAGAEPAG